MITVRNMDNKNILKSIILGIILGFLLTQNGGILFIGFIFLLTILVLQKYFRDPAERNYIVTIFVLGFLIRTLLCAGIHIYNEINGNIYQLMGYSGNCIFGDSATASIISQVKVDIWRKRLDPVLFLTYVQSAHTVQYYIYSLFYFLVGKYELPLKLINVLYGTIAAVFIYLTAKELFGRSVAKISYAAVMFFPSLILWSVANLKEPIQILIFSIWIYSLIKIRKKSRNMMKYILLSASASFAIYTIRPETALFLLLGCIIGLFFSFDIKVKKTILLIMLLGLAAFLFYNLLNDIDIIFTMKLKLADFMKEVITWQSGIYRAAYNHASNYKIYPDQFYAYPQRHFYISAYFFSFPQIAYFISKAIVFFLAVPLPWMIASLSQAIVFPQLILWYIMLVLSFMGFMLTIYRNNRLSYLLAGSLGALIIPMSLVSANIGTVFRHRDLFTPFIIIYASYGFCWLLNKHGSTRIKDG